MFAVIETGGKQYRVNEGSRIRVERLEEKEGASFECPRVLCVGSKDGIKVGNPTVAGAKVMAKVLEHGRGDKILVFKKRRRQNSRRLNGHRQDYTCIEIGKIG